jgi:uncharacterized protein YndB with AHSA1/START domain
VRERAWVSIENAVEIARPPEDVFDYLTDITKEFEWNPRTRRVEKLTPGEIRAGTRFDAEWIKGTRPSWSTSGSSVRPPGDRSLVLHALT